MTLYEIQAINAKVLASCNLVICLGIAWACLCRLNSQISKDYLIARLRYMLLLVGALACGFQPLLFNQWPTAGTVVLTTAVFLGLVLNILRWKHEGPKRRFDDLENSCDSR